MCVSWPSSPRNSQNRIRNYSVPKIVPWCNSTLHRSSPTRTLKSALLTKVVRSRWQVIGQVRFLDFTERDEVELKKKKPLKKSWGQYHAIFDQTSLVNKGFTIWPKRVLSSLAGPTRKIASRQDRPILPALVANPKACFASYYPLADSAT